MSDHDAILSALPFQFEEKPNGFVIFDGKLYGSKAAAMYWAIGPALQAATLLAMMRLK